jgi:hypothetical protein
MKLTSLALLISLVFFVSIGHSETYTFTINGNFGYGIHISWNHGCTIGEITGIRTQISGSGGAANWTCDYSAEIFSGNWRIETVVGNASGDVIIPQDQMFDFTINLQLEEGYEYWGPEEQYGIVDLHVHVDPAVDYQSYCYLIDEVWPITNGVTVEIDYNTEVGVSYQSFGEIKSLYR